MMKLFNIKIISIEILLFGSIINTNIKYNLNSNKELLISISGIMMQLILYIIFNLLYKYNLINLITYNIFLNYNRIIILFNILPIIPLDGSKLLISFLERFFSFKISLIILNVISIITIIIFIFNNDINLNLILISSFLLLKTYINIFNHHFIYYKFLLERYLYKNNYHKIKMIDSINKLYKNKYNFINNESEDKILNKLFDKDSYF